MKAFFNRPLQNFLQVRIATGFASFVVENPMTGKPCIQFSKTDSIDDMVQQQKIMIEAREKWSSLNVNVRKEKLRLFIDNYRNQKDKMVSLIELATGKHKQCAILEVEASIAMLQQDLKQKYPTSIQRTCGLYYFKAFGNILVICDYRMVVLNCLKYLVSSSIAGDCIILSPHRYGLPIAKKIEEIWKASLPEFPLIYCPVNNHADTLEYLVQKKDMGFVSFSGDIEAGNTFYHFMAQKSEILAESEFLLTSSDTAYVLNDNSSEELKKAAKNLAFASFMSGGNTFNSVKRIFVDEQVRQEFTKHFIQFSKSYNIQAVDSKASPIITSGHIKAAKQQFAELKENKEQQLKLLTQFECKDVNKSLYVSPIIYQVNGITNLEYWNKIYHIPICFIEGVYSSQSAIEKINSSIYGISSSIFTSDRSKIETIGDDLNVGVIYGNRWGFSPGVPYSPRKRSGKGFSFSSHSFTNVVKSKSLKGFSQLLE